VPSICNTSLHLEQLVLKRHVILRLQTDTSPQHVHQAAPLLAQRINNRRSSRRQRSLEHVTQNTEHRVETLPLALLLTLAVIAPRDPSHHLRHNHKIDNQGSSEQRVLAHVEDADGLVAAEEDLGVVLVERALVVADGGHVLDDDGVIGVLALLVEDIVGGDHVVDDVGFADLLAAELLLRGQVLAVVVAEVVVGCNGGEFDSGADHEVDEGGLHFGLAGLEVVAADEGFVLLGELDAAGDEGVLRGAVDEGSVFEDAGDGEDGAGRDFFVAGFDCLHEVLGGVVDAGDKVGVALGVRGPEDDDLVEAIGGLEVSNVFAEVLDVLHAGFGAGDDVVGAVFLVGGDEVGVVDTGQRLDGSHLLLDERLQCRLKDLGAVHGSGQVHATDVPATDGEIVGVNHGDHVVQRNVDLAASLCLRAKLDSGRHDNGAIVVCGARTLTGVPAQALTVGKDAGGDGGTIVATESDKHQTDLADIAFGLEVIELLLGRGDVLAIVDVDFGGAVSVLAGDVRVGVLDVGRLDCEEFGLGRGSAVGGRANTALRTVGAFCVRCHDVE
jgi:hypothetical protein